MMEDLKVYRFAVEVQDYETATRYLCAFVAKNPQLNNYRDTLAALYVRNGQYASALATLKKKTAAGNERYGEELRVRALIGLERYDEAQKALTALLEKEKTFTAEFDQALVHLHRKNYDEALKTITALIERQDGPRTLDFAAAQGYGAGATPAVFNYAKALAEKGLGKNAAATFAQAAKLDPDFRPARDAVRP
jgi:tetratricopeptide (TPR) repeat protein